MRIGILIELGDQIATGLGISVNLLLPRELPQPRQSPVRPQRTSARQTKRSAAADMLVEHWGQQYNPSKRSVECRGVRGKDAARVHQVRCTY